MALASIGLTLLVAVGVSGLVSGFSADLLGWAGLDEELSWLVQLLTVALGLTANAVLFFTMFRLLGGEHVPRGSLVSGAVLGAVVFEVLKRAAGLIIAQTQGQPAFQAFGIALVMLVWISYFSRLVLYSACWAWTSPEAREARAREAALEPVAPVQGPALPSGEDALVLPGREDGDDAEHDRSSNATTLAAGAAGAAAALGAVAATRRRKDDT